MAQEAQVSASTPLLCSAGSLQAATCHTKSKLWQLEGRALSDSAGVLQAVEAAEGGREAAKGWLRGREAAWSDGGRCEGASPEDIQALAVRRRAPQVYPLIAVLACKPVISCQVSSMEMDLACVQMLLSPVKDAEPCGHEARS